MRIKSKELSYEAFEALQREPHFPPKKQSVLIRTLLKTLSAGELKKVGFFQD